MKNWRKRNKFGCGFHRKNCGCQLCVTGDKKYNWRGDKACYHGIHMWVASRLGKPKVCWSCGTRKAKRFEWANVSGKYKRLSRGWEKDWLRLCSTCHRAFDYESQAKGERIHNAKLNAQQVLEIRRIYVPHKYSTRRLAREFNVSQHLIMCIIKKRIWKHI